MSSLRSSVDRGRKRMLFQENHLFFYTFAASQFGDIGIVWYETAGNTRIHRILLPSESPSVIGYIRERGGEARPRSSRRIEDLSRRIREFCSGRDVTFRLDDFDLGQCPPFQRRVLLAEYGIPRGQVSTYGRIARHIGHPGAARAVGSALGANPYALVIPCHRAIRGTGELGGYRGGLAMKRTLLELEGIRFSASGKVMAEKLYY